MFTLLFTIITVMLGVGAICSALDSTNNGMSTVLFTSFVVCFVLLIWYT